MEFSLNDYQVRVFSNWITKAVNMPDVFRESLLNVEFTRVGNDPKGKNAFETDGDLTNWLGNNCPFAFIQNQVCDHYGFNRD